MKLLRYISFFVFCGIGISGNAQVTSFLLNSKMDFWAQYPLHDGNEIRLMGYTELLGDPIDLPSPLLIFNEGDSIDLAMRNFSQPAPHTIHLHGLDVDQATDGVPHLSFSIPHDSVGHYIFVAPHAGTYLYHCHVLSTVHVQAGMYGMIIVRPPDGSNYTWDGGYAFDSESAWLFSEIDTNWHQHDIINDPYDPNAPNHLILDYNPQYFLVNGNSENDLSNSESSLTAAVNETVYVRLANIGYYGNRVIFPSALNAQIVASDGRPLPTVVDSDTVVLTPGERYGVLVSATSEFTDQIEVEYFDLNTQQVINTQYPPVTIEGYLSSDSFEKSGFEVFPNPASSIITLNFSNLAEPEGELIIRNIEGKALLFGYKGNQEQNLEMDVSNLASGMYFIEFKTEASSHIEKLIIK